MLLVCIMLIGLVPIGAVALAQDTPITTASNNSIPADAIRIRTETELRAISSGAGRYYVLENDIHLTQEWVPINGFQGTFDGQGHTIHNLFILGSSNRRDVGLFNRVDGGATIKNVTVRIGSQGITGRDSAGGLMASAGHVNIINSHVIGNVTAIDRTDSVNSSFAGGLIGDVFLFNSDSRIENSSVQGNILASNNHGSTTSGGLVGRLAGMASGSLTISNSFTRGTVASFTESTFWAGTGVDAGGFVGASPSIQISLIISNSYTTSDITARFLRAGTDIRSRDTWAGTYLGFGGNVFVEGMFRLYTHRIIRMTSFGGAVFEQVITRCGLSEALTAEQMRTQASFTGWDFDNIWEFRDGENDGFPVLRRQAITAPSDITITWDANGGTVTPTTQTKISGTAIGTLPVPTRDGYTFMGWFDTSAIAGGTRVTVATLVPSTDVTYWARWMPMVVINDITVTWDANGGTVNPTSAVRIPNTNMGTLPVPTRDGFVFVGWFDTQNATGGTQITPNTPVPNDNVTYWARWTDVFISLDNVTSLVGGETSIRAIFSSPSIVPSSETITWSVCDPHAVIVKYWDMRVYDILDVSVLFVPIISNEEGLFEITATVGGVNESAYILVGHHLTISQFDTNRHIGWRYYSTAVPFSFVDVSPAWRADMRLGMRNWNSEDTAFNFVEIEIPIVSFFEIEIPSSMLAPRNPVVVAGRDSEAFGYIYAWIYCATNPLDVIVDSFKITMNSRRISSYAQGRGIVVNNIITSVFVHELGHAIGLEDHPPVRTPNDSVMHGNRDRNLVDRPMPFDIDSVNMLYNPSSETFSYNTSLLHNIGNSELEIVLFSADYMIYDSITDLASQATDIIRVEVLDERVEHLNTWLETPPSGINPYRLYTVYQLRVLEVFQGNSITGDILEIRQVGGRQDNEWLINTDKAPISVGDDLVIFMRASYIENFPSVLLNPYQCVYRFLPDGTLESAHPNNDLVLTIRDLEQITEGNLTARLASFTVSHGTLSPVFNANVFNYTVSVDNSITSITIDAIPVSGATVTGAGTHNLNVGQNTITLTVTAGENTQTYTIVVTRAGATGNGNGGTGLPPTGGGNQQPPQQQQPTEQEPDTQAPPPPPAPLPFADVATTAWYYGYVRTVWENNIFHGIADNQFSPQVSMTRAMFAQALANLENVDLSAYRNVTPTFNDVSSTAWYFEAVEWAVRQGIVLGVGNDNFVPNAPITREQMAVMLYRYADVMGIEFEDSVTATFTDQSAISYWAVDEVNAIQSAGIIIGRPDGRFDPQATATRAEVATIFARFLNVIQ